MKDIKSLYNTLLKIDLSGKVLILDRGFFSEDVILELNKEKINYVLPTWRNSTYYDARIHLTSISFITSG